MLEKLKISIFIFKKEKKINDQMCCQFISGEWSVNQLVAAAQKIYLAFFFKLKQQ